MKKFQCGFRKDHSTLDHLVSFENLFVRFCKRKARFVLYYFFFSNLEKAFDTTWKRRILTDLEFDQELQRKLPTFIQKIFLNATVK